MQIVDGQNVASKRRSTFFVSNVERQLQLKRFDDLRNPIDQFFVGKIFLELGGLKSSKVVDEFRRPDVFDVELFEVDHLFGDVVRLRMNERRIEGIR